jgi:hypothetical protein
MVRTFVIAGHVRRCIIVLTYEHAAAAHVGETEVIGDNNEEVGAFSHDEG